MPDIRTSLLTLYMLLPLSFAAQAKADTYKSYDVAGSSGSSHSDGLTDSGFNVVSTQAGYHIVNGATGMDTFTSVDPHYTYDNGFRLTVTNPGAFLSISEAVSNNGRVVLIGTTATVRNGVFSGYDPVKDLRYSGNSGLLQLDAMGDFTFVAFATNPTSSDDNIYYYDQTSRNVTPEPSSLLMLCSGTCGLLGLYRRRWAKTS